MQEAVIQQIEKPQKNTQMILAPSKTCFISFTAFITYW